MRYFSCECSAINEERARERGRQKRERERDQAGTRSWIVRTKNKLLEVGKKRRNKIELLNAPEHLKTPLVSLSFSHYLLILMLA